MKDITERNYCREMNEVEKQEKGKIEIERMRNWRKMGRKGSKPGKEEETVS